MKRFCILLTGIGLLATTRLHAVYAPIPELEQGKPFTVYLGTGMYYDSNIFGAATGAIDSMVFEFSPKLTFNMSVTPQTFVSAAYRLSLDDILNRPGKKLLDSHEFLARVAHTFTPETEFDLTDSYQISKNPASLLPGVATLVNNDQSYRHNQLDGRFATNFSRRMGVTFKIRASSFNYLNDALGTELDRNEFLGGVALSYAMLPELKAMTEYRRQDIVYSTLGETKDKQSDFLLVGADYVVNPQLATSARLGFEYRQRKGAPDKTAPYVEIGAKYDYSTSSFISIGYGFSLQETSNITLYTDTSVNRFFLNWQQFVTATITASGTASWEPGKLNGRPGISSDLNETSALAGAALTYQPARTWSISATIDYDRVRSDDPSRQLARLRVGANAKYAF